MQVYKVGAEAATLYSRALSEPSSDSERCVQLCNRAASYAAMDLHRKALADAEAAVAIDGGCMRAILLQGEALESLGRSVEAVEVWRRGAATGSSGDVLLVAEAVRLAGGAQEADLSVTTAHCIGAQPSLRSATQRDSRAT